MDDMLNEITQLIKHKKDAIKLKQTDNTVVNKLEGDDNVQINEQVGSSELKGNRNVQINGNHPPHMADLVKEIIKR